MTKEINWEVGQKVWDVVAGEGVVSCIDKEFNYPVGVKFSDGNGRTYTADGKYVDCYETPSLYPYPVEIVRKITKPSIDWEHVDSKFNYLAEDSSGEAFLYEKEPILSLDFWGIQGGKVSAVYMFATYIPGTCVWKESLVARPVEWFR